MKTILSLVVCLGLIGAAGFASSPISNSSAVAPGLVAHLTVSASDTAELQILSDWALHENPNAHGPHTHLSFFSTTLKGAGPQFRDPILWERDRNPSGIAERGTITIDQKNECVVIDLREVVSKPGEPLQTQPSLANGRYPLQSMKLDGPRQAPTLPHSNQLGW